MNKNQKDTIKRVISRAKMDESIIALILCGSLAKGTETNSSDVDLFVVVTDERFNKERVKKNLFWGTDLDSPEFEVEVDGKIIPKDFLKKAWQDGNESIKCTISTAKVIYSIDDEIEELLADKVSLSQNEQTENIRKFYSLMKSSRYSAENDLDNLLFVNKCIYDTIYYACRMILAYNGVLFPCVKHFYNELRNCEKIPGDFFVLMDDVLRSYSIEKLDEFYNRIVGYFDRYQFDNRLRKGYVIENELFWYFDILPYDKL